MLYSTSFATIALHSKHTKGVETYSRTVVARYVGCFVLAPIVHYNNLEGEVWTMSVPTTLKI